MGGQRVTCWNWGEVRVFWISSAVWGRLSPLGRKGRSLARTSALDRMGAIISGVHTLARSTTHTIYQTNPTTHFLHSVIETHFRLRVRITGSLAIRYTTHHTDNMANDSAIIQI